MMTDHPSSYGAAGEPLRYGMETFYVVQGLSENGDGYIRKVPLTY